VFLSASFDKSASILASLPYSSAVANLFSNNR
jgi:hypothetical protein